MIDNWYAWTNFVFQLQTKCVILLELSKVRNFYDYVLKIGVIDKDKTSIELYNIFLNEYHF